MTIILFLSLVLSGGGALAAKPGVDQAIVSYAAMAEEAMFPAVVVRDVNLRLATREFIQSFDQVPENAASETRYPGLKAAATDAAMEAYAETYDSLWPRRKLRSVEFVRSHFTVSEQREIISFFGTSAGKKLIALTFNSPIIERAASQVGRRIAEGKSVSADDLNMEGLDQKSAMTLAEQRQLGLFAGSSAGREFKATGRDRSLLNFQFAKELIDAASPEMMRRASIAAQKFVASHGEKVR